VARQHGTNRKRVENNSRSGAVGARGEPRAGGEGERKAEAEMQAGVRAEAGIMSRDVGGRAETVWWKGVPLTDVLYSSLNVIIDAINTPRSYHHNGKKFNEVCQHVKFFR